MQESGWQQRARGMLYSLALLVCITACSPHQVNDDISEYSERLGRVLDTELTTAEVQPAIAYPQRELLLSAPAQLDINLTRFYQLQQCELGNLVAERNTALGKIQQLPRFDDQQQVISQSVMQVSWSADHRVIDGATMVRFNNVWLDYLSNPLKMLSKLR